MSLARSRLHPRDVCLRLPSHDPTRVPIRPHHMRSAACHAFPRRLGTPVHWSAAAPEQHRFSADTTDSRSQRGTTSMKPASGRRPPTPADVRSAWTGTAGGNCRRRCRASSAGAGVVSRWTAARCRAESWVRPGSGASSAPAVDSPHGSGPGQPRIRVLSTSTSQPAANGSKPCSASQRTTSRLRSDHHARITSRSTSVP